MLGWCDALMFSFPRRSSDLSFEYAPHSTPSLGKDAT